MMLVCVYACVMHIHALSEDSVCSTVVRMERNPFRAMSSLGCCFRVTFTSSSSPFSLADSLSPADMRSPPSLTCSSLLPSTKSPSSEPVFTTPTLWFASPVYSSSPTMSVLCGALPLCVCWVCVNRYTLQGSVCGGVKASVWMLTSCIAAWRLWGEQCAIAGPRMCSTRHAQSSSSSRFSASSRNSQRNWCQTDKWKLKYKVASQKIIPVKTNIYFKSWVLLAGNPLLGCG